MTIMPTPPRVVKTKTDPSQTSYSDNNEGHQGPAFPYRFSFDTWLLRRHTSHINRWEIFCRWSVGAHQRPKALEWCDHGKGKGVTALASDQPTRCCADCTPFLVLNRKLDELNRVMTPGVVYTGTIAGHGWYSTTPGTEFLIRIVTNPEDVEQLRAEASVYELYEAAWTHSESFKSDNLTVPPLEFHGFFQNSSGSAAVIVLKASDRKNKKLRRRVGKGRRIP